MSLRGGVSWTLLSIEFCVLVVFCFVWLCLVGGLSQLSLVLGFRLAVGLSFTGAVRL